MFHGYNLLVIVRRSVYMVEGPAATQLLERLMGMQTFDTRRLSDAKTVPAHLVCPAQWVYDKPAFVSLHNPSTIVLLRMDFRQTYRCHFRALGSKRTEFAAETDPSIVANQINNVMRRVPQQSLRLSDTDIEPAVFLFFEPDFPPIELQI